MRFGTNFLERADYTRQKTGKKHKKENSIQSENNSEGTKKEDSEEKPIFEP